MIRKYALIKICIFSETTLQNRGGIAKRGNRNKKEEKIY
jgi:hypothetical protein